MGLLINPYRFAAAASGPLIAGPTRLYLDSVETPALSPALGVNWGLTTSADRRTARPSKRAAGVDTNKTSAGETTASVIDVLHRQYVSPPLNGAQIVGAGTVKGIIRAYQGSTAGATGDVRAQMEIRVVDSAGVHVGTVLAFDTSALSNEFGTASSTTSARKFPLGWSGAGAVCTPVSAPDQGRIVIEVGGRHHNTIVTSSTSAHHAGTLMLTDCPENETTTADNAPWIEFSDGLLFTEAPTPVARDVQRDSWAVTPSTVPVGVVSSGWLGLLFSFCKDAALTRTAIPSGYTNVVDGTGGTGAPGVDTGTLHGFIDQRTLDGTESGNVSTAWSSAPSPAVHYLLKYSKQGGGAWSVAGTSADDSTIGTGALSVNGTGLTDPGFTVGDVVVVMYANPSTAGTFSAAALTIPGCTFDPLRELVRLDVSTGNNASFLVYETTIVSGTSTGPPTFTMSATSAAGGAGVFLFARIR